jgi:HAD superfamily hydrolase (TIGR01484 family)
MKALNNFTSKNIRYLFSDIDDTMTDQGQLGPEAYEALWLLQRSSIHVIPVTGRPAGWCEMIARMWPVSGVVGENGAFYFRHSPKKMIRHFALSADLRKKYRKVLDENVLPDILHGVHGSALASDQFCRVSDLAIDYCEDVERLPEMAIHQILQIFLKHKATAKVSSIHVNGWFGSYNKLTMCRDFLKREFNIEADKALQEIAFIGDSPNDEPMFAYFPNSFGVANVSEFISQMKNPPAYVASQKGGLGFQEIARKILEQNSLQSK